jgi:hypothetical protein
MNFMKKIIESRISAHNTSTDNVETDSGFDDTNAPSNDTLILSAQSTAKVTPEEEMAPVESFMDRHDHDTAEGDYEQVSNTVDEIETESVASSGFNVTDNSGFDTSGDIDPQVVEVEQNIHFVSTTVNSENPEADEAPHIYSRRVSTLSPSADPTSNKVEEGQADINEALLNAEVENYLESINNTLQNASENTGFSSANSILSEVRQASAPSINTMAKRAEAPKLHHDLSAEMGEHSKSVSGRAVHRRTNRAKTRLLGFESASDDSSNPFNAVGGGSSNTAAQAFVVGWIAVTDGPGRGNSFPLHTGVSQIGRGEDQAVRLNYGDNSISRSNHAAIAYDHEQNKFFLGHGGKANLVRLNSNPVLSTEELCNGDIVEIGETKLRFVAFCDTSFNWGSPAIQNEAAHA